MDERRAMAERDLLLGIHSEHRELVENAAGLLRDLGAERVDLVDADGSPSRRNRNIPVPPIQRAGGGAEPARVDPG
jgi:hypothetical protein